MAKLIIDFHKDRLDTFSHSYLLFMCFYLNTFHKVWSLNTFPSQLCIFYLLLSHE